VIPYPVRTRGWPSGRKGYCLAALASRQKDIGQVRDSSEDGEETMPHEWEELDEVEMASLVSAPRLGAAAFVYK
jgi:hypothetical protein